MSDEKAPSPEEPGEQLTPEQEQMLRQMEEEMRRVSVQDLLAQSVVSILNLSARRIAKEDERDLEQAKVGIDAVRAIADLLEPEPQREVRNALTQIQMLYAKTAGESAGGAAPAEGSGDGPPEADPGGPKRPPPGLWVPGQG